MVRRDGEGGPSNRHTNCSLYVHRTERLRREKASDDRVIIDEWQDADHDD